MTLRLELKTCHYSPKLGQGGRVLAYGFGSRCQTKVFFRISSFLIALSLDVGLSFLSLYHFPVQHASFFLTFTLPIDYVESCFKRTNGL